MTIISILAISIILPELKIYTYLVTEFDCLAKQYQKSVDRMSVAIQARYQ